MHSKLMKALDLAIELRNSPQKAMKCLLEELCLVNGYPSRRRSLVDDARFETIVVKQTKQTVLDEARTKANEDPSLEDTTHVGRITRCH